MLRRTQGEMDVSECPYPRHAVVLLAGEIPVGSINVCFACGDILIWPPFKREASWARKKEKMYDKLMRVYEDVFPQWTRFFEEDLGIAADWEKLRRR